MSAMSGDLIREIERKEELSVKVVIQIQILNDRTIEDEKSRIENRAFENNIRRYHHHRDHLRGERHQLGL